MGGGEKGERETDRERNGVVGGRGEEVDRVVRKVRVRERKKIEGRKRQEFIHWPAVYSNPTGMHAHVQCTCLLVVFQASASQSSLSSSLQRAESQVWPICDKIRHNNTMHVLMSLSS